MRLRGVVVAFAACCLAACATPIYRSSQNFQAFDEDYVTLADAALKLVERSGPVDTIVVADSTDPRIRAQLRKVRKVTSAKDVPLCPE